MITKMVNLECPAGHRHFSPTPKAWVGEMCRAPTERVDTQGRPIICRRYLKAIRKRRKA